MSHATQTTYLDNCGTTMMPPNVITAMVNWCNKGNPSSSYPSARAANTMLEAFRARLREIYGDYHVIFTSGASESNCTAIQCITSAYAEATGRRPHVIVGAVEHKSVLATIENLENRGKITTTIIPVSTSGHIHAADIERAILPNTALVCVMSANNETGAINDVDTICAVAHANGVVYHCDMVQSAGKMVHRNFDSAAISFHKLHGPPGVGALLIKQELLDGWKLCPIIFGSQNSSHRGGTENLPGLGASFAALTHTFTARASKNAHQKRLRDLTIRMLAMKFRVISYEDYVTTHNPAPVTVPTIVFLSGTGPDYLPGVILMSLLWSSTIKNVNGVDSSHLPRAPQVSGNVCNTKMKDALCARGVIVSIGSACNTKSKNASHVLAAMGADSAIRRGTLRISFGDDSTEDDAKKFVASLVALIMKGEHLD